MFPPGIYDTTDDAHYKIICKKSNLKFTNFYINTVLWCVFSVVFCVIHQSSIDFHTILALFWTPGCLDSGPISFQQRFPGFNFTHLLEDQEFQDFARLIVPPIRLKSGSNSSVKSNPSSGDRITNTRKFLTVNQMVMYLQETPQFGKHAYYGCWCFPEGPDEPLNGYGEPVDDIDKTCKRLSQCYKCASMKYGKDKCPSNTHYEFTGIYDRTTGKKTIECCKFSSISESIFSFC